MGYVLPNPNRNLKQLYESTCAHLDIRTLQGKHQKPSLMRTVLAGTHVVARSDSSPVWEEFGIRSGSNIQTVVPRRFKRNGEVVVIGIMRRYKFRNVKCVLSELVVDPCHRMSTKCLGG